MLIVNQTRPVGKLFYLRVIKESNANYYSCYKMMNLYDESSVDMRRYQDCCLSNTLSRQQREVELTETQKILYLPKRLSFLPLLTP